jgi:hypothetical protein
MRLQNDELNLQQKQGVNKEWKSSYFPDAEYEVVNIY